jgi:hypothetical protein
VAIGLIVVLLSIVLVALRAVRGSADRSAVGASLRQLSQAFTNYHVDNEGALLPGYVSTQTSQDRTGLTEPSGISTVRGPGGSALDPEDAASYVWRLAEYLDDWQIVNTGYSTGLREKFAQEVGDGVFGGGTAGADDLGVARAPAIGMNTTWVGGDDRHFIIAPGSAQNVPGNRDPWSNPYDAQAARSASEVRNPAQLVLFAPTRRWNADTWGPAANVPAARAERIGSPAVMPPFFPAPGGGVQGDFTWTAGVAEAVITDPNDAGSWDGDAGLPVVRGYRGEERVPIGRFDGSFGAVTLTELQVDPRFWNPRANPTRIGESQ